MKKTKKSPEKKEKILEKKKSEEDKPEKDEEKEEPSEITFFEIPPEEESKRPRRTVGLEETFRFENIIEKDSLEENLANVETPKKKDLEKDFYKQERYGSKQEEKEDRKYTTQTRANPTKFHRTEIGPTRVSDIKINSPFVTNVNPVRASELEGYSLSNENEGYSLSNIETYSSEKHREQERNRNPFVHEIEKPKIKYE